MRNFALALLLVATVGCARSASDHRGPVDRSVDAAETTVDTTGEHVHDVTSSAGDIIVSAVTFPFRLIGNVFRAIF